MRILIVVSIIAGIVITIILLITYIAKPATSWLSYWQLDKAKSKLVKISQDVLFSNNDQNQTQPTPPQTTDSPTNTSVPTQSLNQSQTKTIKLPGNGRIKIDIKTNTNIQTQTSRRRNCWRYKVTHLDNSTSNLCYTKSDYDQLTNLGYQLSSAQTFYKFNLQTAESYQKEYDKTGSSIYLDAKKDALNQAEKDKTEISQIIYQMQKIEERGFN